MNHYRFGRSKSHPCLTFNELFDTGQKPFLYYFDIFSPEIPNPSVRALCDSMSSCIMSSTVQNNPVVCMRVLEFCEMDHATLKDLHKKCKNTIFIGTFLVGAVHY